MSTEKEITVSAQKALEIVEVLNSTTFKILKSISCKPLYIGTIAKNLGFSAAYMSVRVQALENLKLLSVTYQRGDRGIRKICSSALEKITISLKDEESQSSDSI